MGDSDNSTPADSRTTASRTSEREVALSRAFDHPARAVFDAWTRADLFRQWWAPRSMGMSLSDCEIDARTGGGYRLTFGGDGPQSMTFFGKYLEVTAPARLVWTNDESDDGPITTVTFEDQGARTVVVFSELYPSAEPLADALAGMPAMMSEQFDQLDELLASGRGPA